MRRPFWLPMPLRCRAGHDRAPSGAQNNSDSSNVGSSSDDENEERHGFSVRRRFVDSLVESDSGICIVSYFQLSCFCCLFREGTGLL